MGMIFAPLGCHKVQVVYPHRLFSTVSICGHMFTMNKQFIDSKTHMFSHVYTSLRLAAHASHMSSDGSCGHAVVTACAGGNPIKASVWPSLPRLREYQMALSIRIKVQLRKRHATLQLAGTFLSCCIN